MKKILLLILFVPVFLSCSKYVVPNQKELNQSLSNDPMVKVGRLQNGLHYYIRKNEKPKNQVEFRLVVNVGSVLETEKQLGSAHFVEHMAFNGSRNFKKNDIIRFFQTTGMRFGPDFNAYTTYDETVYRFRIPTDQPELMERGLIVLRDWAAELDFDEDEVNKERKVIIEEERTRKGVWERSMKKFRPYLLNGSRYAERHPIGKMEIIQSISAAELRAFYEKWYQPQRMAVIVVGDVSEAKIEKKIIEMFSSLKSETVVPGLPEYQIPSHQDLKLKVILDPEITESHISIFRKFKKPDLFTERDFREALIEELYISILNSRFYSKEEEKRIYKNVNYEHCHLTRKHECHALKISIKNQKFKESLHEAIQELEKLRRYGIYESELDREKEGIQRKAKSAYKEEQNRKSDEHASDYVNHFLYGNAILSTENYYQLVQKYLSTILIEDINVSRSRYNTTVNSVIGVFAAPDDEPHLFDQSYAAELYKNVRYEKLDPYLDEVSDLPFFTEQIEKGKIIKETTWDKIGVNVWDLPNGGKVVIKPTKFKEDEVLLHLYAPGGMATIAKKDIGFIFLLEKVLFNSGIGPFSKTDLIKRLVFKKIKGHPYVASYEQGFSGSSSPEDSETLIQLIRLALTQPGFKTTVFEEEKENLIEQLKKTQTTAIWKYNSALNAGLYPGNDYVQPITAEKISRLEAEASRRVLSDIFQNKGKFTLLLVGNIDLKTLKPIVETYIASYPIMGKQEEIKDLNIYPVKGQHRVEIKENLEKQAHIYMAISHSYPFDLKKAHQFQSLLQIINIRIMREIRENQGLIYYGGANYQFIPSPKPNSVFFFHLICAPNKVDDVITGVKKILRQLREDPVSAETIAEIQKTQKNSYMKNLVDNGFWIKELKTMLTYQQDINEIVDWENRVDSLSIDILQDSAQKYLNEENMFIGILLPKKD